MNCIRNSIDHRRDEPVFRPASPYGRRIRRNTAWRISAVSGDASQCLLTRQYRASAARCFDIAELRIGWSTEGGGPPLTKHRTHQLRTREEGSTMRDVSS